MSYLDLCPEDMKREIYLTTARVHFSQVLDELLLRTEDVKKTCEHGVKIITKIECDSTCTGCCMMVYGVYGWTTIPHNNTGWATLYKYNNIYDYRRMLRIKYSTQWMLAFK
jgi:hypothetical protein